MTTVDEATPGAPPRLAGGRSLFDFWRSPATKFFVTALLTVALIVPLWMVLALTDERERRRDDVASEVGREWGGPPDLHGPRLIVPFATKLKDATGETITRHLAVLPERLTSPPRRRPRNGASRSTPSRSTSPASMLRGTLPRSMPRASVAT